MNHYSDKVVEFATVLKNENVSNKVNNCYIITLS